MLGPRYSHIYIEQEAAAFPDTEQVLRRYPQARRVMIERYSDLFHRPRQHFQLQKGHPKLILAVAHGKLLHKSDERIESFGEGHIYYNAPIRNCIYNCDYCFLQGMHSSGNMVVFVNHDRLASAAQQFAITNGPYWLSISYLTDLLGFEHVLPFCRRWIEFARQTPQVTLEIRTKSDNFRAINDITPPKNVVLIWSLTPPELARQHEVGTASAANRLFAAAAAAQAGWRVRLCFDPILLVSNWQHLYRHYFQETLKRIAPENIEKVSFGVFRMHPDFLSRIRRMRTKPEILYHSFRLDNGLASYPDQQIEVVRRFVKQTMGTWLPLEKLAFVHG